MGVWLLDGEVCVCRAVHTEHMQGERVVFAECTYDIAITWQSYGNHIGERVVFAECTYDTIRYDTIRYDTNDMI